MSSNVPIKTNIIDLKSGNKIFYVINDENNTLKNLVKNYVNRENPCSNKDSTIFFTNQNLDYEHIYDKTITCKGFDKNHIWYLSFLMLFKEINQILINILNNCDTITAEDINYYNYYILIKYVAIRLLKQYKDNVLLTESVPPNTLLDNEEYNKKDMFNRIVNNQKDLNLGEAINKLNTSLEKLIQKIEEEKNFNEEIDVFIKNFDNKNYNNLDYLNMFKDKNDDIFIDQNIYRELKKFSDNESGNFSDNESGNFSDMELGGRKRRHRKMKTRKAVRKSKPRRKHCSMRKNKRRITFVKRR
jgi:hypothetical protein